MAPDTGAPFCPYCGWKRNADSGSVLHLRPGTMLHGAYLVGRVLGQGGFGITYLGWDNLLQRKVAIKEYFPQVIASRLPGSSTVAPTSNQVNGDFQHGLQSFMNEGRILARFSDHPCIVSVLNLFEDNRTGYLVMGFLEGMTLSQSLGMAGGRIPYEVARDIMMRVMDGLREVHNQGLLHRDISPDNIYLTRQGPVKILDFGAARFEAGERSQSLSVVLKEGYAPEEQYRRSGNQGPWTDIYATAATLYRCITGSVPPPALDRLHADTLQQPHELGAAIPPHAESALMRALAVHAGARFQSVEAFQTALQPVPLGPGGPPGPGPGLGPGGPGFGPAGPGFGPGGPGPGGPGFGPGGPVGPGGYVAPIAQKRGGAAKFIWIGLLIVVLIVIGVLINNKIQADAAAAEAQRQEEQRQENQRVQEENDRKQREEEAEQAKRNAENSVTEAEKLSDQYETWFKERIAQMGGSGYSLTFSNECMNGPIRIVIRFKLPDNTGRWITSGWWKVESGKTLSPTMITDGNTVYFWATGAAGNWNGNDDSNNVTVPIVTNNFVHLDGTEILGKEQQKVTMFHETYSNFGNHTVHFTCPNK